MKMFGSLAITVCILLCSYSSVASEIDEDDGWREAVREAEDSSNAGAFNKAETLWNTALLAMDRAHVPEDAAERRDAYRSLATAYAQLGEPERAVYYRKLFVDALRVAGEGKSPYGTDVLVTALQTLAREYEEIGRWEAALSAIQESISLRTKGGAPLPGDLLELARHFRNRGLLDEAERQYQNAMSLLKDPPTWLHAWVREQYADLLVVLGRDAEARKLLDEARAIRFGAPERIEEQ